MNTIINRWSIQKLEEYYALFINLNVMQSDTKHIDPSDTKGFGTHIE